MRNTEIAKVFQDIADLLELKGENPFKIRAYQRAARTIDHLPKEIEIYLNEGGDLKDILSVGDALSKKIAELVATGKLEYFEKLRQGFPQGLSNLLSIPGVGPKTAMKLSTELGINTVEELEQAILQGRVAQLFRMGQRSAENILHQIQALRLKDQRIPIGEALPLVEERMASLRRFRETL